MKSYYRLLIIIFLTGCTLGRSASVVVFDATQEIPGVRTIEWDYIAIFEACGIEVNSNSKRYNIELNEQNIQALEKVVEVIDLREWYLWGNVMSLKGHENNGLEYILQDLEVHDGRIVVAEELWSANKQTTGKNIYPESSHHGEVPSFTNTFQNENVSNLAPNISQSLDRSAQLQVRGASGALVVPTHSGSCNGIVSRRLWREINALSQSRNLRRRIIDELNLINSEQDTIQFVNDITLRKGKKKKNKENNKGSRRIRGRESIRGGFDTRRQ